MAKKLHSLHFNLRRQAIRLCFAGALLGAVGVPRAFAQSTNSLDAFLKTVSDSGISGFVQGSYFYNTQSPADRQSDGYLWNTTDNTFSINKIKVTLASKPAVRSGTAWDAAYRLSLMFGEDAAILNTSSPRAGLENLREAYAEVNVPIGTGLNFRAGQLISLLNYESGDGGAANGNFSQGYQWYYTGNGPSAGVQLGYSFSDSIDAKVRVQNGLYAGALDGNNGKTVMASIGIKPDDKTWVNLIGFGGDESPTWTVKGASILAGRQLSAQTHLGVEFDYFRINPATPPTPPTTKASDLWSVGGWLSYDFNPKVGLTFRAEYLDDTDTGVGINWAVFGAPLRGDGTRIMSPDAGGDLQSYTLTLNFRPTPKIKIQPEVRYDRTSYTGGFDGEKDRVFVGAGVTYSF